MKPRWIVPWILAAALVASVARAGQEYPTKNPESTAPTPLEPGSGFFVVPDELWMTVAEDADGHFRKAAEAITAADRTRAAHEVHKGTAFLKMEAHRAGKADRPIIEGAAEKLDALAERLRAGEDVPAGTFDALFARAHYVTARHLWNRADREWQGHDQEAAGRDLQGAVLHLSEGMMWTNTKIPVERVEAVEKIGNLADAMLEDGDWTPGQVDPALTTLDNEIRSFGATLGS